MLSRLHLKANRPGVLRQSLIGIWIGERLVAERSKTPDLKAQANAITWRRSRRTEVYRWSALHQCVGTVTNKRNSKWLTPFCDPKCGGTKAIPPGSRIRHDQRGSPKARISMTQKGGFLLGVC